jgi:DNA-binding NarL/FixJ family response regulator
MKNSKPIRILVVDDHFMVRMGLSASLNVEPDMEVVAEAGNGNAALEAYRKHRPSLVMMDLRLPGMSGTECTAAILLEFPEARILMLSTHSGEEEFSAPCGWSQGIHRQEHHPRGTSTRRAGSSPGQTVC